MTSLINRRTFGRGAAVLGLTAVAASTSLMADASATSTHNSIDATPGQAPTTSRQFACWAARLTFDDLPPSVVNKVKAIMLHTLTSAKRQGTNSWVKETLRLVQAEEEKPDEATIFWNGTKATRIGAAHAINEILLASQLFNSYRMRTHPGSVLIPVTLANAEVDRSSGKDLKIVSATGYESMCRLCHNFTPTTSLQGFQPSLVVKTMGAAMVTGKLVGLDEGRLVATISLGVDYASGLVQGGRWQGDRQVTRSGILAGMMARTGHF